MNSEQEHVLVMKVQGGDKESLTLLWDEISPKILGYLINTLKSRELAEDLAQTTWLKAIEALPRFQTRPNQKFSAWLFAIARNECQQYWRRSKTEQGYLEKQYDENNENESSTKENHTSDNNLIIEQVLSKLTEDERELIRLRYIADLSVKDIAKVLEINSITVRVRLHRALNKAQNNLNSNL